MASRIFEKTTKLKQIENKIKSAQIRNIEEYITAFPSETQNILHELRATIKKDAPEAEETINYGIPTLRLVSIPHPLG